MARAARHRVAGEGHHLEEGGDLRQGAPAGCLEGPAGHLLWLLAHEEGGRLGHEEEGRQEAEVPAMPLGRLGRRRLA